MKRYGLWRYLLILFVLGLGIVYSLPNLYAPDPAVQISYTSSSQTADEFLAERVADIIKNEDFDAKIQLENDYVLVRTDSYQNQLKLKELLSSKLINDVVIALNLAPTTPKWLVDIGANPMKLGLDLRGGVHFLMQVDTETALRNRQDGTLQDLRIRLREENIRLKSEVRKLKVINSKASSQELELLELRQLLKVLPERKNKIITGRAITAPGGVFANTILINAGENFGIKVGQPAISSLGLVGYVVNVSLKTSRILLLIDINSMIPVYLTNSNWPAVVQGQSGKLLKLKFLSSKAKPIDGEVVQTSGHGDRLPPGINVGKIVKSFSGKFYVKPIVDFQRLTYISIITNKTSQFFSSKNFQGFAPLQKPKPSINLKGLNFSGKRVIEGLED